MAQKRHRTSVYYTKISHAGGCSGVWNHHSLYMIIPVIFWELMMIFKYMFPVELPIFTLAWISLQLHDFEEMESRQGYWRKVERRTFPRLGGLGCTTSLGKGCRVLEHGHELTLDWRKESTVKWGKYSLKKISSLYILHSQYVYIFFFSFFAYVIIWIYTCISETINPWIFVFLQYFYFHDYCLQISFLIIPVK